MTEPQLSFKEMCARFDVTPRTLRYYEYIELLNPQKDGRSRSYGPREVARMKLILRGRHFGFSLEEIRQWLELYETEGTARQLQTFIAMADRQSQALEDQITALRASLQDLAQLRAETRARLEDLNKN